MKITSTGALTARWIRTFLVCIGWWALCANAAWALTATTSTLRLTAASVSAGANTVLTATITPTAATGTVTFKDGTTTLGTATLSAGTAALTTSFTTLGSHSLTAVYRGSATHATSTSAAKTQTVTAIATTLVLSASPTTLYIGQSSVLTAKITPGAATGAVTFKDGTTSLGTATLSNGTANFTMATGFSTAGTHSLTAVYAGSGSYATSTSAAMVKTVTAAPTTLVLTSTPNTGVVNQALTLKATISPAAAMGTVTFKEGTTTLGTATLSMGVASLSKTFTVAGLHTVTANYASTASYAASTANSLALSVNGPSVAIPVPPASPTPVVSFGYDAQGNLTTVTQDTGTTSTSYDALRRAKTVTDANSGSIQLSYNGSDQLTSLVDPRGLNTQYQRDGFGQTTRLISPDTGSASQTFDAGGNLLTRTDSRGVLATYSYDALSRRTGTVLTQAGKPSQSYSWTYDQTGGMYTNGIGQLTSAIFPEGSTSTAYDAQGRIIQNRQTLAPNANAQALVQYTSYTYDAAGHPTSVTYPSGRHLTISYANGLPIGMGLARDSVSAADPILSGLQFAPFGGPKSWNWAMNNGAKAHTRVLDTNGRMVRYPLGDLLRDLTYDAAGRITSYTHYLAYSGATTGSTSPAQNQQFSYDNLDRLTQVTSPQATWAYTYDANGNRTNVAINNGTPNPYSIDSTSNRLQTLTNPPINITYDAAGNISSDGNFTLSYDLRGRLVRSASMTGGLNTTYTYNNNGQRVRKSSGTAISTTAFVYDQGGQLLGEYDSQGQAIREYVWLGDIPVAVFMPNPAQGANSSIAAPLVFYIHADHTNTPRVVLDKNNAIRWRWMAEPFGTTPAETAPTGQPPFTFALRFPGQYYDQESGMHYNWNRDYIPGIGRYLQSDPIGLDGGINTYSYVVGNPLSYYDPNGQGAVGQAIGGQIGGWVAGGLGIETGPFDVAIALGGRYLGGLAGSALEDWAFAIRVNDPAAQAEHDAYKSRSLQPPPPGDECETLKWLLQREKDVVQGMQAWDARWQPGRHAEAIRQRTNGINKLQQKIKDKCGCP